MEMQRHPGRSADALWNNVLHLNIYEVHVHSIETRHVAPECVDPGSTLNFFSRRMALGKYLTDLDPLSSYLCP